jgi:dGTPase
LRAGLLTLDGLADLDLVGAILRDIRAEYPALPPERMRAELIRRMIRAMIEDVIAESARRLAALDPQSADEIRRGGAPVVAFSATMANADRAIKARLTRDVYRHADVMEVMARAEAVVRSLFDVYRNDPSTLPEGWRPAPGEDPTRTVADFMAGMTDRYALSAHQHFFGGTPELR